MNSNGKLGRQIVNQLDEATLERIQEKCWQNTLSNKPLVNKSLKELAKIYQDKPKIGLIIAAGPSIHRRQVLQTLSSIDFPGVVIVADSALSLCFKLGIIPDIVVSVDPHSRLLRWFGIPHLNHEDLAKDDYFRRQEMNEYFAKDEQQANQETIELINRYGHQVKAALATCSAPGIAQRCLESGMEIYWWNPMYDDYDQADSFTRQVYQEIKLPLINAGGNVGTACWVIAHSVLGLEKIGLIGMDFSYYSDTPYERTQYYYELVELFGQEKLDQVFIPIENPYLKTSFYTDPAYFWYRENFLEMTKEAPCQTFNCTEGGILFGEGINFMEFSEFLLMLEK